MNDQPANDQSTTPQDYVDNYQPPAASTAPASSAPAPAVVNSDQSEATQPAVPAPAPVAPVATPASTVSQALEDQNIFFLLGVMDGSEAEKETFLDELQQVIWDDFLDNDVELLVTEEELAGLKKITAQKELSPLEQQEKVIEYLEKLIPDLEEIMLEKALELKEDLVRERVTSMREYYNQDSAKLQSLNQAEELINDQQWRAAADVLNSLQ